MIKEQTTSDALTLERLVFDKIEFHRNGFKSKGKFEANIQTSISVKADADRVYQVTLQLKGNKEREYSIEITLTGYFIVESALAERSTTLLSQNAVAILMPYLRSEVTLLTSQPETETVVLPIFDVRKMFT
jgi:preprotein translocase subunit SecB